MRFITSIFLASLAVAAPVDLEARQFGGGLFGGGGLGGGAGGCAEVIFMFARGSTEPPTMGILIGPPLERALERQIPSLKTVGINYDAAIMDNVSRGGTTAKQINTATQAFNQQMSQCPDAIFVASGYSQGAALMHRTIEKMPQAQKDRIAAVVLYGDTQNQEDNGQIPNFPREKVKIFCNASDGVCGRSLTVNAGHLSYSGDIQPGAQFLAQGVQRLKQGGGVSSSGSTASTSGSLGGLGSGGLGSLFGGSSGGFGGIFGRRS
ncbi:cutinase-domain-containing protein [Eremomyces bilateralis CBS 781.70]|uniref:cutinase n=1 Tax=Eremomyces bilateralis CBS 781.70 TaxID=1392243 RepID=A0A6G1FQ91_9PEZI|nr:cutinase-domain-containing protein [Eremomyces bilateralis CBS 781.70]KAF1807898.1 cutinase-domain-containing protein [Eremomyces bilateralis CBS 781.70]